MNHINVPWESLVPCGAWTRIATYLAQCDDIPLSKALHAVGAALPDLRLNTRFAARFR